MAVSKKSSAISANSDKYDSELKIKGVEVPVTNLDKIYWPDEKYTKGELLNYYEKAAPYLFPFLKNRPMSMNRFPNGIKKPSFYQKDVIVDQLPEWVKTESVFSASNEKNIHYIVCKNEATILYMVNLGCIELNPWNSHTGNLDKPDYIVIDLDPGNIDFGFVVKTAQATKQVCDEMGVSCYCKTSGATGLHIYIPMHAKYTYEEGRHFGELIAQHVYERTSDYTSLERALAKRGKKKIYIDYLQNSRGQTLASVFSVRPRPGATVSMPLEWKEVNAGLNPAKFTMKNAVKNFKSRSAIFEPVLSETNNIRKALKSIA